MYSGMGCSSEKLLASECYDRKFLPMLSTEWSALEQLSGTVVHTLFLFWKFRSNAGEFPFNHIEESQIKF
jgi:hypothetical protein